MIVSGGMAVRESGFVVRLGFTHSMSCAAGTHVRQHRSKISFRVCILGYETEDMLLYRPLQMVMGGMWRRFTHTAPTVSREGIKHRLGGVRVSRCM
jgi:hypothetical protein